MCCKSHESISVVGFEQNSHVLLDSTQSREPLRIYRFSDLYFAAAPKHAVADNSRQVRVACGIGVDFGQSFRDVE